MTNLDLADLCDTAFAGIICVIIAFAVRINTFLLFMQPGLISCFIKLHTFKYPMLISHANILYKFCIPNEDYRCMIYFYYLIGLHCVQVMLRCKCLKFCNRHAFDTNFNAVRNRNISNMHLRVKCWNTNNRVFVKCI